MIGTSKSRKPPRPATSQPAKRRRVSFVEPSSDERSKENSGSPEPTVTPYDHTAHFGGAHGPQNYVDGGARSATTLIGGPPLAGHFSEQSAGPPWTMRSAPFGRHPDAFEHISDASVLLEEAHNEPGKKALPSLTNFGITVLVASFVTLAIVVALTVDLQSTLVRPQTSGMGVGSEIIVPLEAMKVPGGAAEPRVTARPVVPAEETTRVHLRRRIATHPRLRQILLNGTRRLKQRRGRQCGAAHFYSLCEQASRPEAYYSAASRRCVSTARDGAHVCNRGANRFADFKSCLASCVYRVRQPADDRCFEVTLFTGCSRQDVAGDWWFFDGSGCARWNFPLGKCPAQGSAVFRTREDCDATCLQRDDAGGSDDDRRRCDVPVPAPCSPWQLRFPYFADMRAQGHSRCIKVSSRTLQTRRCLIGSNRFDSLASCDRVCGRSQHV